MASKSIGSAYMITTCPSDKSSELTGTDKVSSNEIDDRIEGSSALLQVLRRWKATRYQQMISEDHFIL